MSSEDIKDSNTLKAWLDGQSAEVSVTIAHRAAMRISPLLWERVPPVSSELELGTLAVARADLISGVAAVFTNSEIKAAANAAVSSADEVKSATIKSAAAFASHAARAAAFAARAASHNSDLNVGTETIPSDEAAIAVDAADAAYAGGSPIGNIRSTEAFNANWAAVREEAAALDGQNAGQTVFKFPLWPKGKNPFAREWQTVRKAWMEAANKDPGWRFWIEWYDAALVGKPLLSDWDHHWALLTKIALIKNETWNEGQDAVNEQVSKLYAGFGPPKNALSSIGDTSKFPFERNALAGLTGLRGATNDAEEMPNALAGNRFKAVVEGAELEKNLARMNADTSRLGDALKSLEIEADKLQKQQHKLLSISEAAQQRAETHAHETTAAFEKLKANLEKDLEAAVAAYTEGQAIKEPVKLWTEKEREHISKMEGALLYFQRGLMAIGLAVCAMIGFVVFSPEVIILAFAPLGCDLSAPTDLCNGFSFRGFLISGGALTLLTLLLWFVRLKMKEYLSERHLALDSRERRAFAQAYIGLLSEGDISEEAKEQRAVVYASLFRPSTDGIVKEEGGLDPSISAAISKLLAGR